MRSRQVFTLGAVLAACAVAVLFAAPVWASYSGDGGVTVSPTTIGAGGSITIDSSGWKPSSSVTITLHSDPLLLGTLTSDDSGTVHSTATIPSGTASGSHTIELTGSSSTGTSRTVSTPITVTSSGGGGSLPRTGAAVAAIALVGLALFGGGSVMATARRRAAR